jgi:hypothetical protein
MTLNASGPISLGGATAGQSINLELGNAATAVASINSAPFRNLAGVASGAISLSNFYGKSNVTYYLIVVTPTSGNPWYDNQQFTVDSAGNIYGCLQTASGSTVISKVSATGSSITTFVSSYTTATNNVRQAQIMATASSGATMVAGNMYLSVFDPNNRSTWSRGIVVNFINAAGAQSVYGNAFKYNASGGPTQVFSNVDTNYRTSSADSSGNFYATFQGAKYYTLICPCSGEPVVDLYNTALMFMKFNSSFGLTFCNVFGDGNGYAYPQSSSAIAAPNGTVFLVGPMGNPHSIVRSITNTNASGVIQWAKYYSITTSSFESSYNELYGCVDSSDNAFMLGPVPNSSLGRVGVVVMKVNSSGTHQWTRALYVQSFSWYTRGGCCDSAGNVYFAGARDSNPYVTVVVKYNSSGVFQWALNITTSSTANTAQSNGRIPRMMPSGALLVPIPTYPNWTPYIYVQLPVDGSKLGTFTVGGATVTIANSTCTAYDLSSSENTRSNGLNLGSSISTVGVSQTTAGAFTATLAVTTI